MFILIIIYLNVDEKMLKKLYFRMDELNLNYHLNLREPKPFELIRDTYVVSRILFETHGVLVGSSGSRPNYKQVVRHLQH